MSTKREAAARRRALAGSAVLLGAVLAGSSASQESGEVKVSLAQSQIRYVAPVAQALRAPARAVSKPALQQSAATALATYAPHFGLTDPAAQLQLARSVSAGPQGDIVRYRQLHEELPVIGGELVLRLDGIGQMVSLSGEVNAALSVERAAPQVSAARAQQTAAIATAKYHGVPISSLVATEPELSIYDAALIGPSDGGRPSVVWRVEVSSLAAPTRELVLVDAATGGVRLHFNQVHAARNRETYTANNGPVLPGTLLCNESQPSCTDGGNVDADAAHRHIGDTYDFYQARHGRDSYNGLGATLRSIVQYDSAVCPNAFWDGAQMVYCASAPLADDVVAHELTHAVTQSTSGLFYYYQSGAINESLSDVWGEFVDITNGSGNDAGGMRWRMGEDWLALGVIRNMANPPEFGDPDRMRAPQYWTAAQDNGGVHINSGVNNKAVTLMVDGGSFNGHVVAGLGVDKVAALYYRVQTEHLTSGSDYADLHLALTQACQNMIGSNNITAANCAQVANALEAVEMRTAPLMDEGAEASLCSANQAPTAVYSEGFETADPTRWSSLIESGSGGWSYTSLYAAAGRQANGTGGSPSASDFALTMLTPVTLPPNAYLHFRHSFEQESFLSGSSVVYYDGGVLEYSTNDGATWLDAGSLHDAGKAYEGALAPTNPLVGRAAFVGASHGYVSSRYDLGALAGASIRFRFRNSSDASVSSPRAWIVDDVRIYTCAADASPNTAPTAGAGADLTVSPQQTVTLDGSNSADADGYLTSSQWTQISGPQVAAQRVGRSLTFTAPATATRETLVFRLTVADDRGATGTDEVAVAVVNQQPTAQAGADQSQKPRAVVNLQGAASDADGSIQSYAWTQTAGQLVTLASTAGPTTSFTAPSVARSEILTFRLTARDNYGGEGIDEISVMVTNDQPVASAGADITVAAGAPVTLNGAATDADGAVASYRWEQIAGPAVSFANGAASTSFSAPSLSSPSTLTFRLTATDNDGGAHADDVTVSVQARPSSGGGGGGGGGAMGWCVLIALAALTLGARRHAQR